MCGIAGVVNTTKRLPITETLLLAMNATQVHRGPDDGNIWLNEFIGFAHRRLSIIDIATGKQPLVSKNKQVIITFNGEIYNYKELRQELIANDFEFNTNSDTEVIVNSWLAWGPDCVNRFNGMFAFALWCFKTKTFFMARDRLGIKPLYYTVLNNGQFLFASELKALQVHPNFPRKLCAKAIEDYFALGYVPDPKTIFSNVFKLPPGHTLLIELGKQLQIRSYWDVKFEHNISDIAVAKEQLGNLLLDSVNLRQISEVPIGAFLSGGVDSSGIVAVMAQLNQQPILTSSIAFNEGQYDESKYARKIAQQYATNHKERCISVADLAIFDRLIECYDEPFADSSALPSYYLCQLAKKNVTVALSGDGADEIFAGYRRQRHFMNQEIVRHLLPKAFRETFFSILGRLYPKLDWLPQWTRAKSTFQSLSLDHIGAYFYIVSILSDERRKKLYSEEFQRHLQGYEAVEVFRAHGAKLNINFDKIGKFNPLDALNLIQYLDIKTYLPGDILTKIDRVSMAHSLEVRVPFLDHRIVSKAASMDPNLKLRQQQGKYILKQYLQEYIPDEILFRPKQGFSLPLKLWFRNQWQQQLKSVLNNEALHDLDIVNPKILRSWINQHIKGYSDFSQPLWSILVFSQFLKLGNQKYGGYALA